MPVKLLFPACSHAPSCRLGNETPIGGENAHRLLVKLGSQVRPALVRVAGCDVFHHLGIEAFLHAKRLQISQRIVGPAVAKLQLRLLANVDDVLGTLDHRRQLDRLANLRKRHRQLILTGVYPRKRPVRFVKRRVQPQGFQKALLCLDDLASAQMNVGKVHPVLAVARLKPDGFLVVLCGQVQVAEPLGDNARNTTDPRLTRVQIKTYLKVFQRIARLAHIDRHLA